jgi:hypothetical protein
VLQVLESNVNPLLKTLKSKPIAANAKTANPMPTSTNNHQVVKPKPIKL